MFANLSISFLPKETIILSHYVTNVKDNYCCALIQISNLASDIDFAWPLCLAAPRGTPLAAVCVTGMIIPAITNSSKASLIFHEFEKNGSQLFDNSIFMPPQL